MSVSTRKDAELMEDGRKWRKYLRLIDARHNNPQYIALLFSIKHEIMDALFEMDKPDKYVLKTISDIFIAYIEKLRKGMNK